MVAVVHVSNVLGTINPVAEIARARPRARARWCWSTASQSVPHMPVDFAGAGLRLPGLHRAQDARARPASACWSARPELLDVDGAVPGRRRDDLRRHHRGLDLERDARGSSRPGTPPIAEAIGLGAAADYLAAHRAWRPCGPTRSTSTDYALDALSGGRGHHDLRPARPRARAAAPSASACRTCTPTTSRSSWTARASACGPATTAPSRSCGVLGVGATARASTHVYNCARRSTRSCAPWAGARAHIRLAGGSGERWAASTTSTRS